jgi:hypothetical protein
VRRSDGGANTGCRSHTNSRGHEQGHRAEHFSRWWLHDVTGGPSAQTLGRSRSRGDRLSAAEHQRGAVPTGLGGTAKP